MDTKLKCFLSYAHVDREFVYDYIVPVLKEKGLDVWIDMEKISSGERIYDSVLKGIKDADFILAVFNIKSTWLTFEVGAAIGQEKPTIGIIRDDFYIPSDLQHIQYIRYFENNIEQFKKRLSYAVEAIYENVIDTTQHKIYQNKKLIGIKVGALNSDFEEELKFTSELISLFTLIIKSKNIQLVNVSKGSFKSLISLDLKEWAELIEKIIFFIPELKKKKIERDKLTAETEKMKAETEKVNSETRRNDIDSEITIQKSKMEQANAMADLLEKYKGLGIKIQFSEELQIEVDEKGNIELRKPKLLEQEDNNSES